MNTEVGSELIALLSLFNGGVLLFAALLDYILGDPWGWPHPVQAIGWAIASYTKVSLKLFRSRKLRRFAGVILGLGTVVLSSCISWLILQLAGQVHPSLSAIAAIILLASCFAGRSLRVAAEDVLRPLTHGNLELARSRLSRYVGRDTQNLSEAEILRAILETVTENATDGVTAPLFYAILGGFFPVVGSVPFAFAYKAASTLDSMVGYRDAPYTDLGWFSAKMEDILTWLPCRLTVITLAILSGRPKYVLQTCQTDATQDPSPNSGWSECAYAAVLGVQLGGINYYRGIAKEKPLLAQPLRPITPARIRQALQLTRTCFLIWLFSAIASQILLNWKFYNQLFL